MHVGLREVNLSRYSGIECELVHTLCIRPVFSIWRSVVLSRRTKSCGQPWGRLAARDPVWDGEGWGCDRVAGLRCLFVSVIAGAGGGDRRTAVAKRDPYIRIALRLPFDEAISG